MRAVLLVSMGGPENLETVSPYLRAIFRDPAILPAPGFVRTFLTEFIILLRAAKVRERYRMIGGASPLLSWTRKQRDALGRVLRERGQDIAVEYAFRYTAPTIRAALSNLRDRDVRDVILLPLFPHSTRAMNGSIIQEAERAAGDLGLNLKFVPAWADDGKIVVLWKDYLMQALETAEAHARILFVAHGIPLRDVRRGDDYPEQVMNTAKMLAASLPSEQEWTLAYQSKVGPLPWTQPYLKDVLQNLCRESKPIIFMPLSFAADCLETLYDLDIQAVKYARDNGVRQVVRVSAFNDDPRFAEALADLTMRIR